MIYNLNNDEMFGVAGGGQCQCADNDMYNLYHVGMESSADACFTKCCDGERSGMGKRDWRYASGTEFIKDVPWTTCEHTIEEEECCTELTAILGGCGDQVVAGR